MPRVSHFDISADDPERAIRFYEQVFGWQIMKWDGPMEYWEIKTGDANELGIDGGLARRDDPSQHITPFIDVPSVDDYQAKVQEAGGEVVQPKTEIPGAGYIAAFKDTEGNTVGIMDMTSSAE